MSYCPSLFGMICWFFKQTWKTGKPHFFIFLVRTSSNWMGDFPVFHVCLPDGNHVLLDATIPKVEDVLIAQHQRNSVLSPVELPYCWVVFVRANNYKWRFQSPILKPKGSLVFLKQCQAKYDMFLPPNDDTVMIPINQNSPLAPGGGRPSRATWTTGGVAGLQVPQRSREPDEVLRIRRVLKCLDKLDEAVFILWKVLSKAKSKRLGFLSLFKTQHVKLWNPVGQQKMHHKSLFKTMVLARYGCKSLHPQNFNHPLPLTFSGQLRLTEGFSQHELREVHAFFEVEKVTSEVRKDVWAELSWAAELVEQNEIQKFGCFFVK